MAVQFRPINFQWTQTSHNEWTVDGWGLDHHKVTFRGPAPSQDQFLNGITKFQKRNGYASVWLADFNATNASPNFPGVDFDYVGFRSGVIPTPKPVDSYSRQSVTGSGMDNVQDPPVQVSGTISFIAKRTTWTWFEISEPSTVPLYGTVHNPVPPVPKSWTIPGGAGGLLPYDEIVTILNSLSLQLVVSDYEVEPIIPGKLYACKSVVDWTIVAG